MKRMLNWIHLSDIHHNYNNYDTIKMRDRLIRYIKDDLAKNILFDFLAITGDISFQGVDYTEETYAFIKDIVSVMGIALDKVYIVPGNHDLKRSGLRTALINSVINNASSVKNSNDIDKEIFQNLLNGQDMFFSFYKNLLSKDFPRDELHFVTKEDMYNIIHINTCWLAGADKEEGKLVICQEKLYKTIKSLENEKSVNVAIGHHSIDCFNEDEQKKFLNNLDSCGIDIYLCGHTHNPGYHFAADGLRTIPMIVCGSNIVTDYANACFVTGKIDFDTCAASIVYHSWDDSGEFWYQDNAIGRKLRSGKLPIMLERLKKKLRLKKRLLQYTLNRNKTIIPQDISPNQNLFLPAGQTNYPCSRKI